MTGTTRGRVAPAADGVTVAALALVIYALLAQSRFYLFDAETFYMLVARGELSHPNHPLYLPLCAALAGLLGTVGVSLFDAMTFASALGSAFWVLAAHRASAAMGLDRREALGAAILSAAVPSVVFFATVVEVHGPFLAFAGCALWQTARARTAPNARRFFELGLTTGLAATAHATGHLLPLLAGFILLAEVPSLRRAGALARAAALGAAGHVGARIAAGLVLGGDLGETLTYVTDQWSRFSAGRLPGTIWHEWLLPAAPPALIALAVLLLPRTPRPLRALALALHGAALVYALAATFMLAGIRENGAYFQPLVLVAAWVTVRSVPTRAVLLAAVVGLTAGIIQVQGHDQAPPAAVDPADVVALRGEDVAVFVMADESEAQPVMLADPTLAVVRLEILAQGLLGAADEDAFARFDAAFRSISAGSGGRVYLSQAAWEVLVQNGDRLRAHVASRYELLPVISGSFRAYELRAAQADGR
jgi:4-amino-4-deoxy-L-arabinose transferase-like glycosyltransferase